MRQINDNKINLKYLFHAIFNILALFTSVRCRIMNIQLNTHTIKTATLTCMLTKFGDFFSVHLVDSTQLHWGFHSMHCLPKLCFMFVSCYMCFRSVSNSLLQLLYWSPFRHQWWRSIANPGWSLQNCWC